MARRLAVLLLVLGACKSQQETTPVGKYDPAAEAAADFEAARAEAAASNRLILMEVGGNWCSWTRRLDQLLESNEQIARTIRSKYVHLRINYSDENHNESFLRQFPKVDGYPYLFILDENGEVLHAQGTGELEAGDRHDPAKVLAVLEKHAPGQAP